MFTINYTMDDSDYIAYNRYHFETSQQGKKSLLFFRLLMPFVGICFLGVFYIIGSETDLILIEALLLGTISFLWILFSKKYFFYILDKSIKKMKVDGKMPYSPVGTFVFDDNFINDINESTEVKSAYSTVEKICITDKGMYIYIGAMQAFVIPTKCFASVEEETNLADFIHSKTNKPIIRQ